MVSTARLDQCHEQDKYPVLSIISPSPRGQVRFTSRREISVLECGVSTSGQSPPNQSGRHVTCSDPRLSSLRFSTLSCTFLPPPSFSFLFFLPVESPSWITASQQAPRLGMRDSVNAMCLPSPLQSSPRRPSRPLVKSSLRRTRGRAPRHLAGPRMAQVGHECHQLIHFLQHNSLFFFLFYSTRFSCLSTYCASIFHASTEGRGS